MGFLEDRSRTTALNGEQSSNAAGPSGSAAACIINSELGAVLAVMRRNVRWGGYYMVDEDQVEHSLINSLKELRRKIFLHQHEWDSINPIMYLQPFLDVIQSEETGAPITGVALSSIYKILYLEVLNLQTIHLENALHLIVETVTRCRFEVTDPVSEEVVLMKILQVLLACMKSQVSRKLSNQHVLSIVNTCFRIVHQASLKGELLQRIARHTMHELIRCVFSRIPDPVSETSSSMGGQCSNVKEASLSCGDASAIESDRLTSDVAQSGQLPCPSPPGVDLHSVGTGSSQSGSRLMSEPYGIPCMIEILHLLCSLLNSVEHIRASSRSPSPLAYEEDLPLFALGLINLAIELGGGSFKKHPQMLSLIQDELFLRLMQFGLSTSPLILSTVCSIALNLYCHYRMELKLQFESFFSCVLLRLAQSKHGTTYQQQVVVMESLIDFCRQPSFAIEMYANFDCNVSCSNVFEDLIGILSRTAFPSNAPLSEIHVLALEGLIAVVHRMSVRPSGAVCLPPVEHDVVEFWEETCGDYGSADHWLPFIRRAKRIKNKMAAAVDRFNEDPKRGLDVLDASGFPLNPMGVARFLRGTHGLDKTVVGDFLGSHDVFCIAVLREFVRTFDFKNTSLDVALRVFLETFRVPGESQKIQRVLEAFADTYHEQSPEILTNRDVALVLSYSIIMLNTDRHNVQVKKKMTEDDFIRNNRRINAGNDLPRRFLSDIYRSICDNEIRVLPDRISTGHPMMTASNWVGLMYRSRRTSSPYIAISGDESGLDRDMFEVASGPSIAAMSVLLDTADRPDVVRSCVDGLRAIAAVSARHSCHNTLDDLVASLCKFTTLLGLDDAGLALSELKPRLTMAAVFAVANEHGGGIRKGWKNVFDCLLTLHRLRLWTFSDPDDDAHERTGTRTGFTPDPIPSTSGLISRFSQFLSFDVSEAPARPVSPADSRDDVAEIVRECRIGAVFTESGTLPEVSLCELVRAVVGDGDASLSGLRVELVMAIVIANRERVMLVWPDVHAMVSRIVGAASAPQDLVGKAVFGVLRVCRRLLPHDAEDALLTSLLLVLKLDARVADVYCEPITVEVLRLVRSSPARVRSAPGWRAVVSLLSITSRHPEASDPGFEALSHVMSAHLLPANYAVCVDAASGFAVSGVGGEDRSLRALDAMGSSVSCLAGWSVSEPEVGVGAMWLRLVRAVGLSCADRRPDVRDCALSVLSGCVLFAGGIRVPDECAIECFDRVVLQSVDRVLESVNGTVEHHYYNYHGDAERSVLLALKLLFKAFLQFLHVLSRTSSFCGTWVGVLARVEASAVARFRGRRSERVDELVREMVKNALLVMMSSGLLVPDDPISGDSFWRLTWSRVDNISPSLRDELFARDDSSKQSHDDEGDDRQGGVIEVA